MRDRELALLEMLDIRVQKEDLAFWPQHRDGFNKAREVVKEWLGLYETPPATPINQPPLGDTGCNDRSAE